MVLNTDCDDEPTEFADDSLGNSFQKNRKRHSGMLVKYKNAVVPASINPQKAVSFSSTEAEYVALNKAAKKLYG